MKKLILAIAIVGAVTTGGSVYALTRGSEQPVKPVAVQSEQPTETTQEETPIIEEPTVVQPQETQVTVEPEETVESILDAQGWSAENRACVDEYQLIRPEWFTDVTTVKRFVQAISTVYVSPCAGNWQAAPGKLYPAFQMKIDERVIL